MARIPVKDEDYEAQGLQPPEHIVHHGSESVNSDGHVHRWIHKDGPFLHCDGMEGGLAHGIPFDHVNKILVGTSPEGAPILEDLTIAQQFVDTTSRESTQ